MRTCGARTDGAGDRALLCFRRRIAALLQGVRGGDARKHPGAVPARLDTQFARLRTRRTAAAARAACTVRRLARSRPLATRPELAELPARHLCGRPRTAAR